MTHGRHAGDVSTNLSRAAGNVSIDFVFDALRDELLARNYLMSNMYAFQTVTPQQRWRDWLRVNDRVVVEAAAIPGRVVFDRGEGADRGRSWRISSRSTKSVRPARSLSDRRNFPRRGAGFRIPRKIDVQFIQANFVDMVTKAEAEVTDEEIAKYYDENKEQFIKADTGLFEDSTGLDEATKTDEAASAEAATDEAKVEETDEPSTTTEEGGETSDVPEAQGDAETEPATEDVTAPENPPEASEPTALRKLNFLRTTRVTKRRLRMPTSRQSTAARLDACSARLPSCKRPRTKVRTRRRPWRSPRRLLPTPHPPRKPLRLQSQPPAPSPQPPARQQQKHPLEMLRLRQPLKSRKNISRLRKFET